MDPLVVVEPLKRRHCAECRRGPLERLVLEFNAPRCLDCADLGHLVFLPRGNAALTRRAREASSLWAVVVRHNRQRTRYERQGLLVEEAALASAEEACLADAEARARRRERDAARRVAEDVRFTARLTAEILRLFPSCPLDRALDVAAHTSVRGSGRVGGGGAPRRGAGGGGRAGPATPPPRAPRAPAPPPPPPAPPPTTARSSPTAPR
ncbi:hypothetical protein, partial [Streptomyces sp. NPDC096153]|uniref:hypothetical protein n=1 Tax=Streptomyces sp. NPDC096153 TaxID=3155548 RepID=UPI00331F7CCE